MQQERIAMGIHEPTTEDRRPMASSDQPSSAPITFGTDGWRAVIAADFTFDNVRRVAGAIASYVLKHEDPSHGVVVGYDTRFGSPIFARAAAERYPLSSSSSGISPRPCSRTRWCDATAGPS